MSDPRNLPDDDPQETELRQLFAARQQRDEAASPSYERLRNRPARARSTRRRSWWLAPAPWAAMGALLLALVALGVIWRTWPRSAPAPDLPAREQLTLETWKAPTDFLLAVPGGELVDSTPAFPDPDLPVLPSLSTSPSGSGPEIPSSHSRRL